MLLFKLMHEWWLTTWGDDMEVPAWYCMIDIDHEIVHENIYIVPEYAPNVLFGRVDMIFIPCMQERLIRNGVWIDRYMHGHQVIGNSSQVQWDPHMGRSYWSLPFCLWYQKQPQQYWYYCRGECRNLHNYCTSNNNVPVWTCWWNSTSIFVIISSCADNV